MEPLSSTLNSSRGFVSPQMLQVFITILQAFRKIMTRQRTIKKGASYHVEFRFSKVRFIGLPRPALQG
jgi:hypothetical protein